MQSWVAAERSRSQKVQSAENVADVLTKHRIQRYSSEIVCASESESNGLSQSSSDMRDMRLSTLIARGGVSLILVVPSRVSVVSSRVIVARIMWVRRRLESEAIVTNSHSLDCFFSRMLCLLP